MRTKVLPFFIGVFVLLFPIRAYCDAYLHSHVHNPPSHHVVTAGNIVEAHLLFPIDCRLRQSGDIFALNDYPIYNNIPGWRNEIIIPSGTMIAGSYQCYPRSIYLSFDRFLLPQSSLVCRYSAPHACHKIMEGNTGERLAVRKGFQIHLITVHSVWIPDPK